MDRENRGFAAAAGLLLLLPFVLFLQFFLMFRGLLAELSFLLYAAERIFLPGLAGFFLLLRKPRAAAIVMTLAALCVLVLEIPEIPRYLGPNGYPAAFDEQSGYAEWIPRAFVVVPILDILGAVFFAAALYLRGRSALALALLSAAAELGYMNRSLAAMNYVTGHPGPNALFPIGLALGALFAGLYLRSLGKQTAEVKETEEA